MSEAKPDQDTIEVLLKKSIQAHGEDVVKLTFRAPTAGDIISIGNPVHIEFKNEAGALTEKISFDDARMSAMIAVLGDIPPSSVRQMAPRDFVNCCWRLRNFFLPE